MIASRLLAYPYHLSWLLALSLKIYDLRRQSAVFSTLHIPISRRQSDFLVWFSSLTKYTYICMKFCQANIFSLANIVCSKWSLIERESNGRHLSRPLAVCCSQWQSTAVFGSLWQYVAVLISTDWLSLPAWAPQARRPTAHSPRSYLGLL